jgi:hypothetical protein
MSWQAEGDRESVKALLSTRWENSAMRQPSSHDWHDNDACARVVNEDQTGNSKTAGSALRHGDFPSPSQMPHDEAWDRVAFSLRTLHSSHSDWRQGMGPATGTHDNRRWTGRSHKSAEKPSWTRQAADQGVQRRRANVRRACTRRCCLLYTQGKGRLRLSGCVLLAGTPQQRPSVSACRHRIFTCCERC